MHIHRHLCFLGPQMHFAHQVQLNAHVRPLETKIAVGDENDE
jgi:hypothetical protein